MGVGAASISASLSSDELRTVVDSLREGLQIVDRDWRYVFVNQAAASHGRTTPEALTGRTMMECYPGIEDTDLFSLLKRCMLDGTTEHLDNEFRYPDGSLGYFELHIEPCAVGLTILSIDVTRGRTLEEQLRHAQKMEAVGRLAGSIAHDFNNLLSVILSFGSLLGMDLKPRDPARSNVEAIMDAGTRAAALTRQLLAFSRKQVLSPRVVDVNEVVTECARLLERLLGEDVRLVTELDGQLDPVYADAGQLDQVIVNLAINARDAMPHGGTLTIETANVTLDAAYQGSHWDVKAGPHVMLAVSDTGTGMTPETQARIFEPFFTTKEDGKGTGLGLSTVFGIVKQSGGSIWVYSEPGDGTTFKVYLPATNRTPSFISELAPPADVSGTETILLVDDQADVRAAAFHALRRFGYHVLEAANPGEALLICEQHRQAIHLLLTDLVMPRMGGVELAARLTALRPTMKVLYVSGYTDNAVLHHGILESGLPFVQKPFVPETLAQRVRQVLDKSRPSQH